MDYTNIYPIFNISPKAIPKGATIGLFSYLGYELLIFVLPYVDDNKKNIKL